MKKIFGISMTLVIIAVLFVGCGGKGTSTTTSQPQTSTSAAATTSTASVTSSKPATTTSATVTTSVAPATSSATSTKTTTTSSTPATSGNDLSALLGKAAVYTNIYCEVKMTSGTITQNMKEWVKTGNPTKLRMEITAGVMTTVMIYDGQYYYMYDPASKIAYKMSAASAQQYSSASSDDSSITQYNPVLIGSETVNGVACSVYQYTVQGVTTTMWISKQSGLAVKLVSGTTTMEYSNYKFDAIADSMFQLPSDAMMITMPGM